MRVYVPNLTLQSVEAFFTEKKAKLKLTPDGKYVVHMINVFYVMVEEEEDGRRNRFGEGFEFSLVLFSCSCVMMLCFSFTDNVARLEFFYKAKKLVLAKMRGRATNPSDSEEEEHV
jgi:hypothetical protein